MCCLVRSVKSTNVASTKKWKLNHRSLQTSLSTFISQKVARTKVQQTNKQTNQNIPQNDTLKTEIDPKRFFLSFNEVLSCLTSVHINPLKRPTDRTASHIVSNLQSFINHQLTLRTDFDSTVVILLPPVIKFIVWRILSNNAKIFILFLRLWICIHYNTSRKRMHNKGR